MLYNMYEYLHASLSPLKFGAMATRMSLRNPFNPLAHTRGGRTMAAMAELIERTTKRFGKPVFGLDHTIIDGKKVNVTEHIVDERPFCNLIKFHRSCKRIDPKVLIVAPLSGHYATLLRGTVEALIPHHNVYITDWTDARQVAMAEGKFDLDDCIQYIMDYIKLLGPDCHVVAVCQPAVPVLAAVSLLSTLEPDKQPESMTLMGGPIDPRVSKTQVTELAEQRPLEWFERNVITTVPAYYPGAFRKVYPGFIQLSGFMSMNLDRHIGSHVDFYNHLIAGDGESAERHRTFYDEYLAVMDLTAEFYLQTVETVFQKHSLATNKMVWTNPETGERVNVRPADITKTALMTVEGELDDISATGQTVAAHFLCEGLNNKKKYHYMQKNVGHYGIFNGRRWREQIMPRLRQFMRLSSVEAKSFSPVPKSDLEIGVNDPVENWKNPKAKEIKTKTGKTATKKKPAAKPKTKAKAPKASAAKAKPKTAPKAKASKTAAVKRAAVSKQDDKQQKTATPSKTMKKAETKANTTTAKKTSKPKKAESKKASTAKKSTKTTKPKAKAKTADTKKQAPKTSKSSKPSKSSKTATKKDAKPTNLKLVSSN